MANLATVLILSLLLPLFPLSHGVTSELTQINNAQTPKDCSNSSSNLVCEIQEMKLKVARLELLLEVTSIELNTKSLHIEKCEKRIEEISHTIHNLELLLSSNLKGTPEDEERLHALEKEVRELEVGVKKNDLDIHLLKVKANDAENRVKYLASQVEMMGNIVRELWFHVQKLEQALEVIQRRTSELWMNIRNHRCPFCKFINKLSGRQNQNMISAYTSEAQKQVRRSISAVKKYHHQLQGFVKGEMKKNEFTAALADEEVVFFLGTDTYATMD